MNLQAQLTQLESELNQVFLERSELIRLMITGILAQTNGFSGGSPGTGKTSLARTITQAFSGRCFYYLMNATTTPDEIIGSVDLQALTNGQGFVRDLSQGLVTADLAILDEGFKANSPCLNSLLGLILDHEYTNGGQVVPSNLNTLWICSNELPDDESLAPFWDRLTLRIWVNDVSRSAKQTIMMRRAGLVPTPQVNTAIALSALQSMQAQAIATPINGSLINTVLNITDELVKEHGLTTSTRKHDQLVGLLRCYAYASGGKEVDEEHLELLEHTLWNKPEERPLIKAALKKFANPIAAKASEILAAAKNVFHEMPQQPSSQTGTWMREVGAADLQLNEMEEKLDELGKQLRASKVRKVKQAKDEILMMRRQIQTLIQKAYAQPVS